MTLSLFANKPGDDVLMFICTWCFYVCFMWLTSSLISEDRNHPLCNEDIGSQAVRKSPLSFIYELPLSVLSLCVVDNSLDCSQRLAPVRCHTYYLLFCIQACLKLKGGDIQDCMPIGTCYMLSVFTRLGLFVASRRRNECFRS